MNGAPRVLLLGWGNSTRSQLVVYEKLYAALGVDATTVIPDARAGLVSPGAYRRTLARPAAELAAEAGARPLLVHLFSDNGFVSWAALLVELAKTEAGRRARDAIRGVIYDSAPGLWAVRGPVDFARRFALGMTPAVARMANLGPRERIPVVTPLLGVAFLAYQLVFRASVRTMLSAPGHVASEQPRCPHLFLFGERDALVPPRDIRAFVERQRDAGLAVEVHAFEDAKHVALFPRDPRRYRAAVGAFVTRALEGAG